MPKTLVNVAEVGQVHLTRKRGQKTMRLRVDNEGRVLVSLPWFVPKKIALDFVRAKQDWIQLQQKNSNLTPYDGMLFAKKHTLKINENSNLVKNSLKNNQLTIHFKASFRQEYPDHIKKVTTAIKKILRTESERILIPRLTELAQSYGFNFNSSSVKQLVGRWGSCDSDGHITLSLYLIQLPIELIDYVLIHELAHTVHMNHSKKFWNQVEVIYPDYRQARKKLKKLQPRVYDAKQLMA